LNTGRKNEFPFFESMSFINGCIDPCEDLISVPQKVIEIPDNKSEDDKKNEYDNSKSEKSENDLDLMDNIVLDGSSKELFVKNPIEGNF
jgi:hypothetical protein